MIQLVYGDDRVKAQQAIIKALGAGYDERLSLLIADALSS